MLRTTTAVQTFLYRLQHNDRGAGLAEYALLLTLIALIAIAGVTALGESLLATFNDIAGRL